MQNTMTCLQEKDDSIVRTQEEEGMIKTACKFFED